MRHPFCSSRYRSRCPPAWWSHRRGAGWSEPELLGPPVSSDRDEWEVAVARNGTLYFSSAHEWGLGDLDPYRVQLVDGKYLEAENLGPPINTSAGDDLPYIAPDESYLIFASNREGALGPRDLYISFRQNGRWTAPQNLGPTINTEGYDNYPFVSPDGKYLFLTRRKAWTTT